MGRRAKASRKIGARKMLHSTLSSSPLKMIVLDKGDQRMDPLLFELLSIATPHKHEELLHPVIAKAIGGDIKPAIDTKGNISFLVKNDKVPKPTTLFSCHMDTVHMKPEILTLCMTIKHIDVPHQAEGMVYASTRSVSLDKDTGVETTKFLPAVLGADDKLGMFIMLKMIQAKIPGYYVFHVGEEVGGIGSIYIANNKQALLKTFKRAVAFDRANYSDIIAFQRSERKCSTKFGKALAEQLNVTMPPKVKFKEDARGTFTDTANYSEFIAECTNVSVGYFNQHGSSEHFDLYWLQSMLLPAILKVDWEALPTERTPGKPVYEYTSYYGSNVHGIATKSKRLTFAEIRGKSGIAANLLPLWHPKDGWPVGISETLMERIITENIVAKELTPWQIAVAMVAYMKVLKIQPTEEAKSDVKIDAQVTSVEKKEGGEIQDKLMKAVGFIEMIRTAWNLGPFRASRQVEGRMELLLNAHDGILNVYANDTNPEAEPNLEDLSLINGNLLAILGTATKHTKMDKELHDRIDDALKHLLTHKEDYGFECIKDSLAALNN